MQHLTRDDCDRLVVSVCERIPRAPAVVTTRVLVT